VFVTHDVDESIFLSDRVLVMSPRPGRITDELAIDLPRPRTLDVLTQTGFVQAKQRILAGLTGAAT
jgi:NitT/TauT family transport system ATP-binding protein